MITNVQFLLQTQNCSFRDLIITIGLGLNLIKMLTFITPVMVYTQFVLKTSKETHLILLQATEHL